MRRPQLFLQQIESEAGLHGMPTSFLGFQNIEKNTPEIWTHVKHIIEISCLKKDVGRFHCHVGPRFINDMWNRFRRHGPRLREQPAHGDCSASGQRGRPRQCLELHWPSASLPRHDSLGHSFHQIPQFTDQSQPRSFSSPNYPSAISGLKRSVSPIVMFFGHWGTVWLSWDTEVAVKLKGSTTQTNWQKKPPKVKNVNLGPNRTRFCSHGTPQLRFPVRMSRRHLPFLKQRLTISGVSYGLIMYHSSKNSRHLAIHMPVIWWHGSVPECSTTKIHCFIMMFFLFLKLYAYHIPECGTKSYQVTRLCLTYPNIV